MKYKLQTTKYELRSMIKIILIGKGFVFSANKKEY